MFHFYFNRLRDSSPNKSKGVGAHSRLLLQRKMVKTKLEYRPHDIGNWVTSEGGETE